MKNAKEKFIIVQSISVIVACVSTGLLTICWDGYSQKVLRNTPVNIGSRLELFVDCTLIGTLKGVELRLHSPVKLPLPKSPLRGGYTTVIKDYNIYRA